MGSKVAGILGTGGGMDLRYRLVSQIPVHVCESSRQGSALLQEIVLNNKPGKLRIILHIQLSENVGTVGTYGFDAQGELNGNLADRLAGGDQTHYLVFTVGKTMQEIFLIGIAVA